MTTIVQLSDTHFGTEVPQVVEAVKQSIERIRPDIIILSGDITQRARKDQFASAKAFISALRQRNVLVIPGNHDIPLFHLIARLFWPYKNYRQRFGQCENILCYRNVCVVGLDATSPWRHVNGKVRHSRAEPLLQRARRQMKEGDKLIVCAHQPLAAAWPQDEGNRLINYEMSAAFFASHHVDMVLSGHVHVPIIQATTKIFPDLARHFVLSGAGTAISRRTRPNAPNSFNVIMIDQGITVTLMEYDAGAGAFVARNKASYELGGPGWHDV